MGQTSLKSKSVVEAYKEVTHILYSLPCQYIIYKMNLHVITEAKCILTKSVLQLSMYTFFKSNRISLMQLYIIIPKFIIHVQHNK